MSTTEVIVEHLIGGLQAAIWIVLLVLTIFGYTWISEEFLKDYATQVGFVVFAIAYPLGIFLDELADVILKPWSDRIRRKRFAKEGLDPDDPNTTAFYILQRVQDDFVKSYFNYIRMRIRISRSAAMNIIMMLLTGVLFCLIRLSGNLDVIVAIIIFGTGGSFLALWAWHSFTDNFAKQVTRAFKTIPA